MVTPVAESKSRATDNFSTDDIVEGQGQLRILDKTGDLKFIWDHENEDEVEAARDTFEQRQKEGFTGFHVKKDGEKGKQMRRFDPKAEKIIMIPRMVGG